MPGSILHYLLSWVDTLIVNNTITRFIADSLERAGKTFAQFYLGTWMLRAGVLDSTMHRDGTAAFDLLFTETNLKAGIVGVALSFATSIGSKQIGANDSASLLPANIDPPQEDE